MELLIANDPETLEQRALKQFLRDLDTTRIDDNFHTWLKTVTPYWHWDWDHQIYLYPYLEKVVSGDIKRLIISMPPRHGKTEMITVRLPIYLLERWPYKKVILGAYNQTVANNFSRKSLKVAKNRLNLSRDKQAASEWETAENGGYRAVGVGSGITGFGGDLILIDDPVKNIEEARSRLYQEKTFDWYKNDLATRLEPDGRMIIIMTRWSDGDLAGRIMASEEGPDFTVINLPALAETNDPLGRVEGTALCPARYDATDLWLLKRRMGQDFYALYQGSPVAAEGAMFKADWWNYYKELPDKTLWKRRIVSMDTAFKTGKASDYTAIICAIETTNGKIYITNVIREKLEFPELKRRLTSIIQEFPVDALLIEDKASGQSLVQELQRGTGLPVLPIKVSADKISRAAAAAPTIEAGNIYIKDGADWVAEFIFELSRFPAGAHDDQTDALTQLINWVRGGSGDMIW